MTDLTARCVWVEKLGQWFIVNRMLSRTFMRDILFPIPKNHYRRILWYIYVYRIRYTPSVVHTQVCDSEGKFRIYIFPITKYLSVCVVTVYLLSY